MNKTTLFQMIAGILIILGTSGIAFTIGYVMGNNAIKQNTTEVIYQKQQLVDNQWETERGIFNGSAVQR